MPAPAPCRLPCGVRSSHGFSPVSTRPYLSPLRHWGRGLVFCEAHWQMNPLGFALRHPLAVLVAVTALALGSVFSVNRMRTDVFPDLKQPIIYVAQPYGGMDTAPVGGLVPNSLE